MGNDPYERFLDGDQKPSLWANAVSRVTMGLLGPTLIFAGYKCIRLANRLYDDEYRRFPDLSHYWGSSDARYPWEIGVVLIAIGALLCAAAILPMAKLENLFSGSTTPRRRGIERMKPRDPDHY